MSTLGHPLLEPARPGYLDTPSMGLPVPATIAAVTAELERWAEGSAEYPRWESAETETRDRWSRARDLPVDEVGTGTGTSAAFAAMVRSWHTPGRRIVVHRGEFRSLLLPALAVAPEADIRWVDGPFTSSAFAAAIDDSTDVVLASSIASLTGERIDLDALAARTHRAGARLIVDSTQSEGLVPVPYPGVDGLATAGYKGLLGPRGTAFFFAREADSPVPVAPSPYGMADSGNGSYGPPLAPASGARGLTQSPAWLSWVGARPALNELESIPATTRAEHVLGLSAALRELLTEAAVTVVPSELPSPIACIPSSDAPAVCRQLASRGIRCAARGRYLRAGFHVYNTLDDVHALAESLLTMPSLLERNPQ